MGSYRKQWVFFRACGCPFGLVEALRFPDRGKPGYLTEEQAWKFMYDTKTERKAAAARGVRAELFSHDQYSREIYPQMVSTAPCPHAPAKTGGVATGA